MHFKLNISAGGSGSNYHQSGNNKKAVIDHIKTLNLDQFTIKQLLIDVNNCPEGALQHFIDNINEKIKNIRKKK